MSNLIDHTLFKENYNTKDAINYIVKKALNLIISLFKLNNVTNFSFIKDLDNLDNEYLNKYKHMHQLEDNYISLINDIVCEQVKLNKIILDLLYKKYGDQVINIITEIEENYHSKFLDTDEMKIEKQPKSKLKDLFNELQIQPHKKIKIDIYEQIYTSLLYFVMFIFNRIYHEDKQEIIYDYIVDQIVMKHKINEEELLYNILHYVYVYYDYYKHEYVDLYINIQDNINNNLSMNNKELKKINKYHIIEYYKFE